MIESVAQYWDKLTQPQAAVVGAVAAIIGCVITALGGLIAILASLNTARKLRIGAAITADRLKWVLDIRTQTASFCGSVASIKALLAKNKRSEKIEDLLIELNRSGAMIRALVFPEFLPKFSKKVPHREMPPFDKLIQDAVIEIIAKVNLRNFSEIEVLTDGLIDRVQRHTITEWRKAKHEAQKGHVGDPSTYSK